MGDIVILLRAGESISTFISVDHTPASTNIFGLSLLTTISGPLC